MLMLILSNTNAMILMTDFEKAGGGEGGGGDQKRFLELRRAEARQLKTRTQANTRVGYKFDRKYEILVWLGTSNSIKYWCYRL